MAEGYKTLVAGSRGLESGGLVARAIGTAGWTVSEVIGGSACAIDAAAKGVAMASAIPYTAVAADYGSYHQGAEAVRNKEMAEQAEKGIFVWDGKSRNTKQLIGLMKDAGKEVMVMKVPHVGDKRIEKAEAEGRSVVSARAAVRVTRYNRAPGRRGSGTRGADGGEGGEV